MIIFKVYFMFPFNLCCLPKHELEFSQSSPPNASISCLKFWLSFVQKMNQMCRNREKHGFRRYLKIEVKHCINAYCIHYAKRLRNPNEARQCFPSTCFYAYRILIVGSSMNRGSFLSHWNANIVLWSITLLLSFLYHLSIK